MTNRQIAARETKKKLLEIGEKLIAEKGFDTVSVEEITCACGFAKGTFYSYFKRKEDIVFAIGAKMFDALQQEMHSMADAPIIEQLQHYCIRFMEMLEHYGIQICRQWVRNFIDPSQIPPEMEITKLEYDTQVLTRILQTAVERGMLSPATQVDAIVNLLICQLYGMMTCWCMSDGVFEPKEWVGRFCEMQLHSVLAPYLSGT